MNHRRSMRLGPGTLAPLLALLAGCGGGSSDSTQTATEGALAAARSGELVSYVQAKARERQQLQARNFGVLPMVGMVAEGAPSAQGGVAAATGVAQSGTTVQEDGVDEDDLIKADGSTIITLVRASSLEVAKPWARVQLHSRRADGGIDPLAALDLPPDAKEVGFAQGLYHAPSVARVAVLSESQLPYAFDICGGVPRCGLASLMPVAPIYLKNTVWVDLLSVDDPAAPAWTERLRIDGRLIGSRRIGNSLVLVTQHIPQLAVEALPADASAAARETAIASMTAADVLPKLARANAAAAPLMPESDCFVQPANASAGIEITTVTVIDLSAASTKPISRCFAGGTEALYMSPTSLYLATTRYGYDPMPALVRFAPQTSTDIHKFAISAGAIDYRGSGEVAGHLGWDPQKKSYRMSEHKADLRVLTYSAELGWGLPASATAPGAPPPSPATLYVLRENAAQKSLQIIGKLPNADRPAPLGKPGEQVYAVRFLGDRGYVVTFRRTDPLYVLELAEPTDPKAVGELLVAGFSDYLFPAGDGLLLGVGKDASATGVVGGVKVALFDVADPARPQQLGVQVFGAAGSSSGLDYTRHGIDLFARGDTLRVALPLWLWQGFAQPGARGLQRLEVNMRERTLSAGALIAAPNAISAFDLSTDRALQIEDNVYYFVQGQLSAWKW